MIAANGRAWDYNSPPPPHLNADELDLWQKRVCCFRDASPGKVKELLETISDLREKLTPKPSVWGTSAIGWQDWKHSAFIATAAEY